MSRRVPRRSVLRGMLRGGAVATVGLPLFDCWLNNNGTAFASGAPLPVRFGTWHWGCGMNLARWVPKTIGGKYDLPPELQVIAPYKEKVNILSGSRILLGDASPEPHATGIWALRTGADPSWAGERDLPSFDVIIADAIGQSTRFRSIDVATTGSKQSTLSRRNETTRNPSETTPLALYNRIFGEGFQDPNKAEFTPDPNVMLEKSAISAVLEDANRLAQDLGATDRARLDQYFTSLRQIERQLELQLQRPPKAEACVVPAPPQDVEVTLAKAGGGVVGTDMDDVLLNHKLMTELIGMALLCNQTNCFNVLFSESASTLRRKGFPDIHHAYTHNEVVDEKLGYQPNVTWFIERTMEAWADFLRILDGYKEGDGTLLDQMLVQAHSDTSFAHIHALENIPLMLAGKAGGRMKSGLHIPLKGEPSTRSVLTAMQIMGVPVSKFGFNGMETSKPVVELIA